MLANHTLIIKKDKTVWGFGDGAYGQFGNGVLSKIAVPTQATVTLSEIVQIEGTGVASFILLNDGTVWYAGSVSGMESHVYTKLTFSNNAFITKLRIKYNNFFAFDNAGNIYAIGDNSYGQYGNNSTSANYSLTPALIHTSASNIVDMAVGLNFCIFLKSDGSVHAAGVNTSGQLGIGTTTNTTTLTQVIPPPATEGDPRVSIIGAGGYTGYAIKSNGELYSWGYGAYYTLGSGAATNLLTPTLVSGFTTSVNSKIVSGHHQALLLNKDTNTLYGWGSSSYQSHMGNTTSVISVPTQVMTGVADVATGTSFTLALKTDGTVWAAGNGASGQIGNGKITSTNYPNTQVATGMNKIGTGDTFSVMANVSGTIYSFGKNDNGQMGLGFSSSTSIPVQVETNGKQVVAGAEFSLLLKTDGTVYSTGSNASYQLGRGTSSSLENGYFGQIAGLTDIKQVDCGQSFGTALKKSGECYVWGVNSYGVLGDGTTTTRDTPVLYLKPNIVKIIAGAWTFYTIDADGNLWASGRNNYGMVTINGTTDSSSYSTPRLIDTNVADAAVGETHAIWVKKDGTLWGVGLNSSYQLGLGNSTTTYNKTQLSSDTDWASVKADYAYSMAQKRNGKWYYTGYNSFGTAGTGTTSTITMWTELTQSIMSNLLTFGLGRTHIIWITKDNAVYGTGYGDKGKLGNLSQTLSHNVPKLITAINDAISTMGYTKVETRYLLQDGTEIKSWNATTQTWSVVGSAPATEAMFLNSGMTNLEGISKTAMSQLVSSSPSLLFWIGEATSGTKQATIYHIPQGKLVLASGDMNLLSIESIANVTLTSTVSGQGLVKVIVSTDKGVTWKYWDSLDSSWKTVNISDVANVKTYGMTPALLNSLNTIDWGKLTTDAQGVKAETIRFGYYLEQVALTDVANTDKLSMNFNMKGKWSKTADVDYYYEYPNNKTLVVEVYKDGDYKVNY